MNEFEDAEAWINWLVEEGAIYYTGNLTEDGDLEVGYNVPRLREVCPEAYDVLMTDLEREMIDMVDKGLLEVEWSDIENDFIYKVPDEIRDQLDPQN